MKRRVSCWRWPFSFENLERQRGGICSANGFFWTTTRFGLFVPRCSIHRRKCLFQTGPRLTATGLCRRPWLQLRNRRSLVLVARNRATGCASIHSRRLAFLLQLASSFERIEHHVVAFMAGVFRDVVAGLPPVLAVCLSSARPAVCGE